MGIDVYNLYIYDFVKSIGKFFNFVSIIVVDDLIRVGLDFFLIDKINKVEGIFFVGGN